MGVGGDNGGSGTRHRCRDRLRCAFQGDEAHDTLVKGPLTRFLPEIVAALLLGIPGGISIPYYYAYGDVTWVFSVIWGLATLASVSLVWAVRRSGEDWRKELRILFVASAVVGVVSIVTGIGNNATDEPFAMPAYLGALLQGHDPYYSVVSVSYTARTLNLWSNTVHLRTYYSYLPLGLFFQVPGTGALGYRAVCLASWMGIVYFVRRDEFAALCLVSPSVALLAANGFSDLPVLLLLTFSLRGATGSTSKAAEYATYAMKQFANVFWVVYYVVRRDAVRTALVVAVTLAFAAPFILWHPTGIWCEALTFSASPGCSTAPNQSRHWSDLYSHWNYYIWPLWVYALYHAEIHRYARGAWTRLSNRWSAATAPPKARVE